ncbi:hypothetical protein AB0M29_19205 [Streptomyces sp. NPDC051976]|uniref:hypothetical protein n=1 Tax=Streptomyces sp. NPDC051976 TaxID=3154947 RepID=UPI003426BC22
MPDPLIESPLRGEEAFEDQESEEAAWSRAAQLVGLGLQLAGQGEVLWADDDASELLIPEVPGLSAPFPAEYAELFLQDHFGTRTPFPWRQFPGWSQPIASYTQDRVSPPPERWWRQFGGWEESVARPLYQAITTSGAPAAAAASLLHVSQLSRHRIVRVAAAAAIANFRTTLSWPTIEALVEGCSSTNDTIQQMAVDALIRVAPSHPVLAALREGQEREEENGTDEAHTSIIVPGTWTRFSRPSWWRPGEPLFSYLQNEPGNSEPSDGTFEPIGKDLYAKDNYFRWPTGLTLSDRVAGAHQLANWAVRHKCTNGFSKVFAHSHGGNVALLAAARHKIGIDLLVMIATPPHQRTSLEWATISQHVKRIVSLRPRFDMVVLLDRAWSAVRDIPVTGEFPSDRVCSLQVPVWYGHSVLTQPEVWTKHRLASEMSSEWETSQPPGTLRW